VTAVAARLLDAMNAHDLDATTSFVAQDYRSDHPAHPARGFTARDQVRGGWSAIFRGVPGLRADPVASSTRVSGSGSSCGSTGRAWIAAQLDLRGVIVSELHNDVIAAAHRYPGETETGGENIAETVARGTNQMNDANTILAAVRA